VDDVTGVLSASPPRFEHDDVARIAREVFGLEAEVERRFDSERDQNFQLVLGGDERMVLKISNAGERADVLDMETRAALHALRVDPTLPIARPRPIAADPGMFVGAVDGDARDDPGITHMVRLFDHLEGRASTDGMDLDLDALWDYGAIVGRLSAALRGFFHPAAGRVLLWNVAHCLELRPMTPDIEDAARRTLVRRVFDRFESHVLPAWPRLRAQVIHGDLTLDNALLDDRGRIAGIVDFGDMAHTAVLADPVSALDSTLAMRKGNELFAAGHALVDGFESRVPLDAEERALIGEVLAARLALTVTISAWRVRRYPENAQYIQGWDREAWSILEQFDELGFDETARRFGAPHPRPATADLIARRDHVFGTALSPLTYSEPLDLVRGEGVWLEDVAGRRFLDAYNNVPVAGHSHPRVSGAIARQSRLLNTNLRYLHPSAIELAERLVGSMPQGSGLDTVLFVNAGSEATDLAWRLAVAATGNGGGLVTAHAYHGVTTAATALSPEEWRGGWTPGFVEPFAPPDAYRGGGDDPETAVASIDGAIARLADVGLAPAALFLDTLFTSDGILIPPPESVRALCGRVREPGGLVVADEVQAGYGRTGTHLWSFAALDVEPDLVCLGKPMGNGHPIAAVIARRAHVERLGETAEFFSTFGGNPVAAEAGLAVLDVVEDRGLIERAATVGTHLRAGLESLAASHGRIGDVRGCGLLLGVDLVRDRDTREPDPALAERVLDGMRERAVLIGTTGPADNVLKVRPPLVISNDEADLIVRTLDQTLAALT
jgi:4-aminobutyrate aminotransferase-like enzyme/Ser/Thr protein kinase RdoA (MazF antagonist)